MTDNTLQTEFEFTLPQGYVDDEGTLHREGRMRLATAADEIRPLSDAQVQSNSSYLTITLLARVVTELGTLETVDADVIENLFVADLEYLQSMYERVNNRGRNAVVTACPDCGERFDVEVETGAVLVETPDGSAAAESDGDGADGDAHLDGAAEVEAGNASE
ncbi:hypothetical protein [Halovivax cerinus]|uniref:Phage tail assembly protein n=1 Tax=Halovivax cerinus TaxID=1487865 RepID=A0ABD5NTA3_9EURY|nr:hypothetical protein [Halovivax cerinus]